MINPKKQDCNHQQKSSSHFSSVNKFDFPLPIKKLTSKKSPPKPDLIANQKKQKLNEQNIRKAKYYWQMRNEYHNERNKAKERQQKINMKQQEEKKKKILDQLKQKKIQLQKLEQQRQDAIKKHGQAIQNAKKLHHNLEIKRLMSQQVAIQQKNKQHQRYKTALVKVKSQKLLNQFYINQQLSTKRHQTRNMYKSRQRQAAEQYKIERQAYDKEAQQIKRHKQSNQLQDKFVTSIKLKTGKNINFDNTCYHNFNQNIIVVDDSKDYHTQASSSLQFIKGNNTSKREFQRLYTERKSLKQDLAEENRQKSVQRGRQALKRLKQAKQYTKYMEQMQEEQKNYNIERIETGKLNQFIGLKPQTLKHHQRTKKQNAEQEFENVFFTPQKNRKQINIQGFSKGFSVTDRTMYSENRTQPTQRQRCSKNNIIDKGVSKRKYKNQQNHKQKNEPLKKDKNIYTLPYNSKIHGIMLQKSRPEYYRNLFQQHQVQIINKAPIRQKIQYSQTILLDYSMTEDENQYF